MLHNIISMLTQTMTLIGESSQESAQRLHEIEVQLTRAVMIEDVQQLRMQLDECLRDLRAEANRQKAQAAAQALEIQRQVERANQNIAAIKAGDEIDGVTGLPGRSAAMAVFSKNLGTPGHRYVVIAVVNRMQSINARFGHEVGDQVIKIIADFARVKLSGADYLFRWSGPALVALLERDEIIESIRADIRRISQSHIERMLELGGRKVRVPLSASWLVLPLGGSLPELSKCIDAFVASQVPQDELLKGDTI
jgi:diguanylate cyclase (GGDEF)-like protein